MKGGKAVRNHHKRGNGTFCFKKKKKRQAGDSRNEAGQLPRV